MLFTSLICSVASRVICRWGLGDCTWEPPEHFSDPSQIQELLDSWEAEDPNSSVESLRPNDTIFLNEVHHLATARIAKWAREF